MVQQYRINYVAKKFNISISRIVEILNQKGQELVLNHKTRLNKLQLDILSEELAVEIIKDTNAKRSSKLIFNYYYDDVVKIFKSVPENQYYPDDFSPFNNELSLETFRELLEFEIVADKMDFKGVKTFLKRLIKGFKLKKRLIDFRTFISSKILIQVFYSYNTETENNNEGRFYKLHYR